MDVDEINDDGKQVGTVNGQNAHWIANTGPNFFIAPEKKQRPRTVAIKDTFTLQTEFKKQTRIWCPVAAQKSLKRLFDQSKFPSSVWLAWELGYIGWDDDQAQLRYTADWRQVVLALGIFAGLGWTVFWLVSVGQVGTASWRWAGIMIYESAVALLLFCMLELMVNRPRTLVKTLRKNQPGPLPIQ